MFVTAALKFPGFSYLNVLFCVFLTDPDKENKLKCVGLTIKLLKHQVLLDSFNIFKPKNSYYTDWVTRDN